MKFTGKIVRVSKQGKINLPKAMFKKISFNPKIHQLSFYQEGENLVIQKKEMVCYITGKVTNDLTELLPGIFISQEGMILLLKELKKI